LPLFAQSLAVSLFLAQAVFSKNAEKKRKTRKMTTEVRARRPSNFSKAQKFSVFCLKNKKENTKNKQKVTRARQAVLCGWVILGCISSLQRRNSYTHYHNFMPGGMKLFGKAKKGPTAKEGITKMRETLEMLEKREAYLQTKINHEVTEAKRFMAAKNKRGKRFFTCFLFLYNYIMY
jgi:hypothetical protein